MSGFPLPKGRDRWEIGKELFPGSLKFPQGELMEGLWGGKGQECSEEGHPSG